MSNRASFSLHLWLAFFMPILALAFVVLGAYMAGVHGQVVPAVIGVCGVVACVWLFCVNVVHCVEAVGREIDAAAECARRRRELNFALYEGLERAPTRKPPRSGHRNGRAA